MPVHISVACICVGLKAFRTGVSRIESGATKLGPLENRASTCFTLRREAQKGPPLWSTFSFVHLAGTEALAEDAAHVEMIGGPNLNRGISTFASVVETLAGDPAAVTAAPCVIDPTCISSGYGWRNSESTSEYTRVFTMRSCRRFRYGSSKLTTLLRSALGGNCKTHALVPLRLANKSGEEKSTATLLTLCSNLKRVTIYPVLGSVELRGLEARYVRPPLRGRL